VSGHAGLEGKESRFGIPALPRALMPWETWAI
jgi:hypothetical protein